MKRSGIQVPRGTPRIPLRSIRATWDSLFRKSPKTARGVLESYVSRNDNFLTRGELGDQFRQMRLSFFDSDCCRHEAFPLLSDISLQIFGKGSQYRGVVETTPRTIVALSPLRLQLDLERVEVARHHVPEGRCRSQFDDLFLPKALLHLTIKIILHFGFLRQFFRVPQH